MKRIITQFLFLMVLLVKSAITFAGISSSKIAPESSIKHPRWSAWQEERTGEQPFSPVVTARSKRYIIKKGGLNYVTFSEEPVQQQ